MPGISRSLPAFGSLGPREHRKTRLSRTLISGRLFIYNRIGHLARVCTWRTGALARPLATAPATAVSFAIMNKKQLLDVLTKSLEKLPDDALVNLGQNEVTIPFARHGVPYALIRISSTVGRLRPVRQPSRVIAGAAPLAPTLPPQLAACPLARALPRWLVIAGSLSSRRMRRCAPRRLRAVCSASQSKPGRSERMGKG